MHPELKELKEDINAVLDSLEKTVYAAARDVRALKRTACADYANAIRYTHRENNYSEPNDSADIDLSRFAMYNRSHQLIERGDVDRRITHHNRWARGIKAVERVVAEYGGEIFANNMPLDHYLDTWQAREIPIKINVRISFDDQWKLPKLRELVKG